nr:zinc finger, CCHC-type [Tanacetum cinerariifolium]
MIDSRLVLKQYNELLAILERFTQHKMNMDESIQVSCIIDKLPLSWKDFKHTLKHLKDELTLVKLGSHLRIEESLKVQDNDKPNATMLLVYSDWMDTIQLENAVSTISQEYLLEFTSEYGIPESLHPELPGPEEPIVEFPKGKVGVYTKFFEFANFHMDLFSLISAPNPAKVKTGTRPRAAHEVPLLTATASRVIDMEDTAMASGSSGTPFAVEKSQLDFVDEDPPQVIIKRVEEATTEVIPESSLEKEVAAMGPIVNKRRRKRGNEGARANAPPKVLRKDYAAFLPAQSTRGEKSIVLIGLDAGSAFFMPTAQDVRATVKSVSDPDLLETAIEVPTGHVVTTEVQGGISAESLESGKSTPFQYVDGSPEGIYQPGWGVTNNCRLDTPHACQDMVDYVVPSGLLKKATTKIAERDQRIKAREEEIKKLNQEIKSLRTMETKVHGLRNQAKNLETLLEAEVDMKKAAEAKNAGLAKELESLLTGEERIKAAFEEFKKYEDDRVNSRCEEIDARLDALSIDFDEELYPHMLTAITIFPDVVSAGVAKGMSKGLKHGIEHGKANLNLAANEAYDLEADAKYVTVLHALKDLKYPLVDQLDKLKDASIDLIMASLYLESNSGEDAPQWICEFRPSSSQLKIPVYPEVHDPKDPWSFKEEIRFDGVPVSVPIVAPQGFAILLSDTATQTEIFEDEASPRLLIFKSLPPMYNLD